MQAAMRFAIIMGALNTTVAATRRDGAANTKPSVEDFPPVVVETVPRAGDANVDAAKVKKIRVTFSKPMMDEQWSWVQSSPETFPKVAAKPSFDATHRSCSLPVQLERGRTYTVWLNTAKFQNFKDAGGLPAVPYLLVFATKP